MSEGHALPPYRRNVLLGYALLVAVIAVAWASTVTGGPIFDDHFLVTRQSCFRSLEGVLRILQFEPSYACTYRPVRYVSYALDTALFGDAFWGHHVGNIFWHAVATLLAGGLAARLFRDVGIERRSAAWAGLAVAALWALHPVQTDSVSYVSGRRDILAGGLTFSTLWLALIAERRGGLWWLLPLWSMLLAFLSKESAVVIPVLFVIWRFRGGGVRAWIRSNRSLAAAIAVAFLLAGLFIVYRGVLLSHSNRGFTWWGGSWASNFATVAVLQVRYLLHVATAAPLIGDYYPETIRLARGFGDPRAIAGLLCVMGLLLVSIALRRRRPVAAYGCLFYLVALAPMSHVFPHHELYAEHYLYLPLFGLMLSAVDLGRWWLSLRAPRSPARTTALILALALVWFSGRVAWRNAAWVDEEAFYSAAFEHAPNNSRVRFNLAMIRFEQERAQETLALLLPLMPTWKPGARMERRAARACVVAALAIDERDVALGCARQLAAHHPEDVDGLRWRAELAAQAGHQREALESARRWWLLTGDLEALEMALRSAAAASVTDWSELSPLLRGAAEQGERLSEGGHFAVGFLLARTGNPADAYAWLTAWRPDGSRTGYDGLICALYEQAGEGPMPSYCASPDTSGAQIPADDRRGDGE